MKAKQPRLERAPWWMSCVCFRDVRRSLHYPSRLNGFFPLPHRFGYINRGAARILWKREGSICYWVSEDVHLSLDTTPERSHGEMAFCFLERRKISGSKFRVANCFLPCCFLYPHSLRMAGNYFKYVFWGALAKSFENAAPVNEKPSQVR